MPTKLQKQMLLLEKMSDDVGLVYCWMDYYRNGEIVYEHHPELRGFVFDQVLVEQRLGGCLTLLVRRSVLEEVSGFDESLPRGNDGDFIRRICAKYSVDVVPKVLVRVHTDSDDRITSRSEKGLRNAIRGEQRKLEKFDSYLAGRSDLRAAVLRKMANHWRLLGKTDQSNKLLKEAEQLERETTPMLERAYRAYSGLPEWIKSPYRWIRDLLPHRFRKLIRSSVSKNEWELRRLRFKDRFKLNNLNDIYEEEWFAERNEGVWSQDIRTYCDVVWEKFEPASVADLGCGTGGYLKRFREQGAEMVFGLEGTQGALEHAVVSSICKHDLRTPYSADMKYELVQCLEVAEHIHRIYADVLVETAVGLCRSDGHILFTAAPPGQGGVHHINLQPKEYWIKKFEARNCVYLEQLTEQLKQNFNFKKLHWLRENLMVFRKEDISSQ